MGKHSPVAVAPRYMQEFRCAGSNCPENCCTGWSVTIDKASFQRYREVRTEPLQRLVRESLKRSSDGHGKAYASIQMRADGACPFLDERQLCRIHGELGEQALSDTCSGYPRHYGVDGEQHRLYATLSCPEAARLALSAGDTLDPVALELPFANPQLVPVIVRRHSVAAEEPDPVRKHARLIGSAVEGLIRLPTLSAAQSLVQAGLMIRRIARIESAGEGVGEGADAELAQAMTLYLSPQALAQAPAMLGALSVPREAQVANLFDTTQRYLKANSGRTSFRELLADVERGLALEQGAAAVVARLETAVRDIWAPLEAAHPHLLKNYLLNDLGKSIFPSQGRAEIEREFMSLALRFALIKFYALGLAAWRGGDFGPDDVVRVVYVVARNIEHNRSFLAELLKEIEAQGNLRLDFLATLVL